MNKDYLEFLDSLFKNKGFFKNKFIVVEGIDGSGKTTLVERLIRSLQRSSRTPYSTLKYAYPTQKLKGFSLADYLDDFKEQNKIIKEELEEGFNIICDRYYWSTLAYQDFSSKENQELFKREINNLIEPDLWVYINCDVSVALSRIENRGEKISPYETKENLIRVKSNYDQILQAAYLQGQPIQVVAGTEPDIDFLISKLI